MHRFLFQVFFFFVINNKNENKNIVLYVNNLNISDSYFSKIYASCDVFSSSKVVYFFNNNESEPQHDDN